MPRNVLNIFQKEVTLMIRNRELSQFLKGLNPGLNLVAGSNLASQTLILSCGQTWVSFRTRHALANRHSESPFEC